MSVMHKNKATYPLEIRTVAITYRNHNENINRSTNRAVRELVVIHALDELNIISELGKIATAADVMFMH